MNAPAISQNDNAWTLMDDREALQLYAHRGDPQAFEVLARRYQAMVLATCRRALGNETDAEDAAQETFLKLARQASSIRTNVAAWLHTCAMRTSVDLIRRAGSRRRAEQAVMRGAAAIAKGDLHEETQALWRDIEPVIDAAMEVLDEADRELIAGRFLAGRPQAELAREAGVSEGTISRRLERAVGKLRSQLAARGLSVGVAALLPGALAEGASTTVSGPFSASVAKIGLSGITGGGGAATVTGAGLSAKVAAVLIGLSTLAGGGWYASTQWSPGTTPGNTPAVNLAQPGGDAVARPSRTQDGFQLISAAHPSFGFGGVEVAPNQLRVILDADPETGRVADFTLKILDIDRTGENPVLQMRILRIRTLPGMNPQMKEGQRLDAEVSFDRFGRIVMAPVLPDIQFGKNEPAWYGVRPPEGWPEHDEIPDDAGELGILGPWAASERWPVSLTQDEIVFGTENWQAAVFRIINWTEADGYSRATTIHAGGFDVRLVGTRYKMLIRKTPDGVYEIATYPPQANKGDRWPTGFKYTADNPVQVFRFAEAD